MEFVTEIARENYRELVRAYMQPGARAPGKHLPRDVTAALYVLAHCGLNVERFAPAMGVNAISFTSVLSLPWSSGYRTMIRLAAHLYNQGEDITPWEIFNNLDEVNTQVALNALRIAYDLSCPRTKGGQP